VIKRNLNLCNFSAAAAAAAAAGAGGGLEKSRNKVSTNTSVEDERKSGKTVRTEMKSHFCSKNEWKSKLDSVASLSL
jgi:RNase H-fold protein (predicted Holliday junction resolvase)